MDDFKSELRQRMRREFSLSDRAALAAEDSRIWERVEALPEYTAARTVLVYLSLPDEVSTEAFVARWFGRKRVVVPRVVSDSECGMVLCEYSPSDVVPGHFGVMEPSSDAAVVEPSEVDFAIVPGVAFDSRGARLGRGKGYYDRLLPSLGCLCVGVCHRFRLVDAVPVGPHDVNVDRVVCG